MSSTLRRSAAALTVAAALSLLPRASEAVGVILDPCLLSGNLVVDQTLGNSPFVLSSGSISNGCETVGDTSFGEFDQSGGTNSVTSQPLVLGNQTGSFGQYHLTGGTLLLGSIVTGAGQSFLDVSGGTLSYTSVSVNTLWVGASTTGNLSAGAGQSLAAGSLIVGINGGNGTLSIGTGANVSATNLSVGATVGSQGTVNMTDGAVTTNGTNVATSGTATFNQGGGAQTIHGALTLGAAGSGNGTYNLSGGTLTADSEVIGGISFGTFNQSGGTHSVSGNLLLGNFSAIQGQYNLTGGTLDVGSISHGPGSSFLGINGGTLNLGSSLSVNTLWVGAGAPGSFAVGAGQSVETGSFVVGTNSGNGSFTIDDGADVSAIGLSVAATVGSQGTVTMNGGTLTTDGTTVGGSGTGIFDQAGGTHTVSGALQLGAFGSGNGTYDLSGGTLTDASASIGKLSPGTFVQTGGSHATTGDLAFGGFGGVNGTYTLQGGSFDVGGNITTGPGTGTLNLDGGTLAMAPGHSISVTTLALGSAPGTDGVYTQSSGSLNANAMTVGQQGDGTLTQTGGTAAVGTDLLLGSAASTTGTYTLQGGSLVVTGNLDAGAGTGILNLDGGSLSVGGEISVTTLNLGSDALHNGSFSLLAGNVTAASLNVGLDGAGDFQQSGGSVDATSLAIAADPGSAGHYALSGGTLTAGSMLNNGLLQYTGGSIALSGAFDNNGIYQQSGGSLLLPSGASHQNTGSMTFDSTSQLRLLGSLANDGAITLNGAQVTGTALFSNDPGGTLQGPGAISSPFANAGVLLLPGPGATKVTQAFANSGSIQLDDAASSLLGGAITNTGTIQGLGTIANDVANAGTVESVGGTLALTGTLGNAATGLLAAGGGTKLLATGGLGTNLGTINLTGGTFDNNNHPLTNAGQISGFGILRTGGLTNQANVTLATGVSTVNGSVTNQSTGRIEVAHGSAVFTGPVENQGTFKTTGATVSFAGGFVNSGAFLSDPSTQSFSDLTIAPTGYLTGGLHDVFDVSGSFINQSTQNTLWDTRQASLVFNGSGSQDVLLAGLDKGALEVGFQDNFAWGSVELGSSAGLNIGSGSGGKRALYVGVFALDGGLGQLASIVSDSNIYYDPALAGNGYLQDKTYALDGTGFLMPIPEPSTWELLASSVFLLGYLRSRPRLLD